MQAESQGGAGIEAAQTAHCLSQVTYSLSILAKLKSVNFNTFPIFRMFCQNFKQKNIKIRKKKS